MHSIDHIGIAVNSLAEAVPAFAALLGSNVSGTEEVPSEGVRVAFFGEGPGRIELLEPLAPDSPVARHLERRGEGVHHLCVSTPDLEAALRRAEEAGLRVVPPRIRVGAGAHRVAFLHPKQTSGVLIELIESNQDE
ncbi:MAG: methylmalonyl-CoA epimerase [Gemmatimonadota bacterium]